MAFSELETKKHEKVIRAFMEKMRPPVEMRHELDLGYRIEGQIVEIFEIRPFYRNPKEKIEEPVANT